MNKRVLIVDNEPEVLSGLNRILREVCLVDTAQCPDDAIQKVEHGKAYAVVITDLMMPKIDGLELLQKINRIDPLSTKIMLTGCTSQQSAINAINEGKVFKFLRKPYNTDALISTVKDALEEFKKRVWLQKYILKQGSCLKELPPRIHFQKNQDPLTGLSSRALFLSHLTDALQNTKENHTFIHINLDFFHLINDSIGYKGGDYLLQQVSKLVRDRFPKGGMATRLSGNTFCLLLRHDKGTNLNEPIISFYTDLNHFAFSWKRQKIELTASMGVIPVESQKYSVHTLLSLGEIACKIAKEKGRPGINFGNAADEKLSAQLSEKAWVSKLQGSITNNRFHLFQQAIMPISIEKALGFHYEILLRYIDKNGVTFSPAEFLPVAEHYQLSTKIDKWVIDTYARWLASHPAHLTKLHMASINLSGLSIIDKTMANFITDTFYKYQIPPEKICLEITETAAVGELSEAVAFISQLKDKGFRFALDDFGSGWSSYAYLQSLPVDILKIDGSFIQNINSNPKNLALTKSITEIGHTMNLEVIAEYVEDKVIFDKLKEMRIDYAQGYHIAKPENLFCTLSFLESRKS